MEFQYQAEKFAAARRNLMLPHPGGETRSIADAFHECSLGLHGLKPALLDDAARLWVARLEGLMDTTGIKDPSNRGTWLIKAEQLSEAQRFEVSQVVDELADWFDRHMPASLCAKIG